MIDGLGVCAYLARMSERDDGVKAQLDADQVRAALGEAVRRMVDDDGDPDDGEYRFAYVATYTGKPEETVVVAEGSYGPTGDSLRYMQYPYKIVNQRGDSPRIDIDTRSGVEVLADFRPASEFTRSAPVEAGKTDDDLEAEPEPEPALVDGGMHRIAVRRLEAKVASDGSRKIRGYASIFGAEDREGEIMMPGAFDQGIEAFRAAPVMLYNHGFDSRVGNKVIGSWDLVRPDQKGLYVEGTVAEGDPDADMVWNLIDQGHINALRRGWQEVGVGQADGALGPRRDLRGVGAGDAVRHLRGGEGRAAAAVRRVRREEPRGTDGTLR